MKDLLTVFFGGGGILILIAGLLLLFPVLFLWVINSLAEAGGSSFYIDHNLWNYWVAFIAGLVLRGGVSSSSK